MSRIAPRVFNQVSSRLRNFFREEKGFVEVHPQSQLDILTACEDPNNIRSFVMNGSVWPLRQTGQMVLEHEMLRDPSAPGYFAYQHRIAMNQTQGLDVMIASFPCLNLKCMVAWKT